MTTATDRNPRGPGLFERTIQDVNGEPVGRVVTNRLAGSERRPGAVLLAVASCLLLLLAAAQGYVSWRAQYQFVNAAGKPPLAAALEALGLDAAAVIFALLGLAHARMGRPARVERCLNLACAFGSMFMNLLAADLASPRSIAVYVLPPVLYAAGSDRLIAVAGSAAGVRDTSLWRIVGAAAPYALRFVLAPPSTARGLRRAVLAATPLADPDAGSPAADVPVCRVYPPAVPEPVPAVPERGNGPGPEGAARAPEVFAADLAAGKTPSIRRIRDKLGCGQDKAAQIQAWLRARRAHPGSGGGTP